MRRYVANVAKYTVSGNTVQTSVSLSAGKHSLVVVAYENNGAALTATDTITVQ